MNRIACLYLACWLMLVHGAFGQNSTSHSAVADPAISVTNAEIQQAI